MQYSAAVAAPAPVCSPGYPHFHTYRNTLHHELLFTRIRIYIYIFFLFLLAFAISSFDCYIPSPCRMIILDFYYLLLSISLGSLANDLSDRAHCSRPRRHRRRRATTATRTSPHVCAFVCVRTYGRRNVWRRRRRTRAVLSLSLSSRKVRKYMHRERSVCVSSQQQPPPAALAACCLLSALSLSLSLLPRVKYIISFGCSSSFSLSRLQQFLHRFTRRRRQTANIYIHGHTHRSTKNENSLLSSLQSTCGAVTYVGARSVCIKETDARSLSLVLSSLFSVLSFSAHTTEKKKAKNRASRDLRWLLRYCRGARSRPPSRERSLAALSLSLARSLGSTSPPHSPTGALFYT